MIAHVTPTFVRRLRRTVYFDIKISQIILMRDCIDTRNPKIRESVKLHPYEFSLMIGDIRLCHETLRLFHNTFWQGSHVRVEQQIAPCVRVANLPKIRAVML